MMATYKTIRDPLNGGRWQVRVLSRPDRHTTLWADAGDACDTRAEAYAKQAEFEERDRREEEEQSYGDVTDELNDGSPDQLALDDLNPKMVERARRYAEREQLPWPPNVGDFDRYCEARWERERREAARR